ncbi:MAG TPA: hypothetical protein VFS21_38890 [Roseiflexaceae bacterium]|nr:hypothetical protein [Roseiflexaceae bacterium]
MDTNRESTTDPTVPAHGKHIIFDRASRQHAMYFEGELIGFARTPSEAETTLDTAVYEILSHRARWTQAPVEADALPLPSTDEIAEVLDEHTALPLPDAPLYAEAAAQLVAGVPLLTDGAATLVGDVLVRAAPARVGWPLWCACGPARCWHAALVEAVAVARERQADAPTVWLVAA